MASGLPSPATTPDTWSAAAADPPGGPFTGAVLTGGRSTRMGRDKAFVEVRGTPLVLVAASALRDAGAAPVFAVGGDAETVAGLRSLGLPVVDDRHPGEGPLGGVLSALAEAPTDVVAVLSCDLPHVIADAVEAVVTALDTDRAAAAAVPEVDGRLEVLLAAYRASCLPVLAAAFAAGERSLTRALRQVHVAPVTLADPRWARNANRPEDLPGG
jgi:molybdopterin-guanine dinucleotide biosynthesis protein A